MHKTKLKETIWGGIAGMLLFSGVYIILVFAISYAARILPANGLTLQKFFCMNKWTFQGIHAGFIVVVGVGVTSGAIVGWQCSRVTQKWFVPAAMLGIPAILVGWFLYTYAIRVSIPENMKLADCTNNIVNVHLKVPKGHAYHLELRMPEIHAMPNGVVASTYKFTGRVRISSEASLITDFPIGSDRAWLTADGFVLTGVGSQSTNVPALSQFFQAQKGYHIEITLNPAPPPSTSLWLYWLQSRIDTEK